MKKQILLLLMLVYTIASFADPRRRFPLNAGDGSVESPFIIQSCDEMRILAEDVNSGTDYSGLWFRLANDLDYEQEPVDEYGSNYLPIGTGDHPFMGFFNGDGHTIQHVIVNATGNADVDAFNGLFGCAYGLIMRLTLEKSTITGFSRTGGILGCGGFDLYDCHVGTGVSIKVVGSNNGYLAQSIGGIVGEYSGTIEGCTNEADVNSESREAILCGGIVGLMYSGSMKYCLNLGNVNGVFAVGGLVGIIEGDFEGFTCCYYAGMCGAAGAVGGESEPYDTDGAYRAQEYNTPPPGLDFDNYEGYSYDLVAITSCNVLHFRDTYYYSDGTQSDFPVGNWIDSPGYYDISWYNTDASYFQISTSKQLAGIAWLVQNGVTFEGQRLILVNDIDLRQHYWTPIGNGEHHFFGSFLGRQHTISGLQIEKLSNDQDAEFCGLFGYLSSGNVDAVAISDSYIRGGNHTGAIVGYNTGYITNCHVRSNVNIYACEGDPMNIGGVVGFNLYGSLYGCTSSATIDFQSGGDGVGGIVGRSASGEINDCLNLGFISTKYTYGRGSILGAGYSSYSNNFYGGQSTFGAVNDEDVDGAKKATESPTDPGNLGNLRTSYPSFDGFSYVAYDNGLYFKGIYYYDADVSAGHFPIYAGDEGTKSAPYQIKTPQDLLYLAENVNDGKDFSFHYFLLVNDIDFTGMPALDENGSNYVPIGTADHPFQGYFLGNGKKISGININRIGKTDNDMYNGLFGFVGGPYGFVQDLTLADSRIAGYHYTGGIAGCNQWKITNCHVLSDVTICAGVAGACVLGGIVGQNDCLRSSIHGYIIGCTNAATVTSLGLPSCISYGGIAGSCVKPSGGYNYIATIENCLNTGLVSAEDRIGGILGYNGAFLDADNVTGCYFAAPAQWSRGVGNLGYDINVPGISYAFPYTYDPDLGEPTIQYVGADGTQGLVLYANGAQYDGMYYTTQKSTHTVTFTKEGYATIYDSLLSPELTWDKNMQAYTVTTDGSGGIAYQLIAANDWQLCETDNIPAGVPALIYCADAVGKEDPADRTYDLYRGEAGEVQGDYPDNYLRGTDRETFTTGGDFYYKLGNQGGEFGWIYGSEDGKAFLVPAYSAYLAVNAATDKVLGTTYPGHLIPLSDKGPDALIGLPADSVPGNGPVYNLSGQRIGNGQLIMENGKLKPGIYIVNGKKVLIR